MPNNLALVRKAAFRLQSQRCYYCYLPMWQGSPFSFASAHGLSLKQARLLQCTAEHLIARQDGGSNTRSNIVAACRHCNQTRHKRPTPLSPDQYRQLVQQRLGKGGWHSSCLLRKLGR